MPFGSHTVARTIGRFMHMEAVFASREKPRDPTADVNSVAVLYEFDRPLGVH
jgi:hypothetical protein